MGKGGSLWGRVSTVALFAIGGVAIGAAIMVLAVLVIEPSEKTPHFAVLIALAWCVYGFVPAALTGAVYVFLPSGLLRIALAPLIAAAVSAVWLAATDSFFFPWGIAVAAVAALICAALARPLFAGAPKQTAS